LYLLNRRAMIDGAVKRGGEIDRSLAAGVLAILVSAGWPATAADTPKRGGTLTYMIPADAPPSFDGHREATFATVHAVAPFYSVLVRVNPENPASTTDFVCDVCTPRRPLFSASSTRRMRLSRRSPIPTPFYTRRRFSIATPAGSRRTSWARVPFVLRNISSGSRSHATSAAKKLSCQSFTG
jgi:hypothetical protein